MTGYRDYDEPISNPSYVAHSVMERANFFTDRWYQLNRFWRKDVAVSLLALSLATVATAAGTKQLKGDLMRYRPFVQLAVYSALAIATVSKTDAIRFRREAEIGWRNNAETRIEFTEDVVQQAGDRKWNPYAPIRTEQITGAVQPTGMLDAPPPEPQIENVAQHVVNSRLPVLIVAGTGSGKTTVLEQIIREAKQADPNCVIHLFDGKPTADRKIAGIKRTKGYHSVVSPNQVPQFEGEMRHVVEQMMSDSRGPDSDRMLILCDEINNACKKADLYKLDQKELAANEQDKRDYREYLQTYQGLIISQGREKNCLGVATTHTANTQALGIDSNERNNNSFLILGSSQSFDNIELLLSGSGVRLINNPKTLERLNEQYEYHKPLLFTGFYALTNINGDWRLVRLPDWRGECPDVFPQENALNSPPSPDLSFLNKTTRTGVSATIDVAQPKSEPNQTPQLSSKQEAKLREAVWDAIQRGLSPSRIIKEVIKLPGWSYNQKKALYERLSATEETFSDNHQH